MLKAIDPKLDSIIEHKGFDELMKVLSGALDNDGQLKANVDYNALLGLLGETRCAHRRAAAFTQPAGRIVIDPSGIKPSDIVRDIGGVAGDDADVRNLVNAFGGVLDAIEGMNEARVESSDSAANQARHRAALAARVRSLRWPNIRLESVWPSNNYASWKASDTIS